MKPSLLNISKAMAFATAIGAASAAWATVFPGSTDFENEAVPDTTYTEGSAVISQIETPPNVATRPAHYPYESSRTNVLEIDTGADAPVFRKLNAEGTSVVGDIYVDMLVKPTAVFAHDASPTNAPATDKLLVYFKDDGNGTNNLCVLAEYVDGENGLTKGECVLATPQPVGSLDKDTWYRLVIEAKDVDHYPCFNVYLGGYGTDFLCKRNGDPDFYSLLIDPDNYDPENPLPSAVAKVGFAGSGFVDDFVAYDIDPDAVVTVPFTLTWPSGVTAVSYTVDGGEPTAISGDSGMQISVPDGAVVAFTFQNADGATKTMSATASSSVNEIDATGATFGWAEYLGDAVNGAYTIDDANDLDMLRKGVAAGLSTTGETFKQTADIDMASAGAFAGIGTYNSAEVDGIKEGDPRGGVRFEGTYDGDGNKIMNVSFTSRNYAGIFNQVNGAVIENLTVSNITGKSAAIVGNAGNGATLRNLVAEGTFGSSETPCSHNAAGIVIRVSGGTSGDGTQILYCTNNATIYGSYTKLAGICAISQEKIPDNPKMVFTGCANNGTLILNRNSNGITGFAGIVGYSDVNTTMTDCSNTGTLTQLGTGYNTDHTGALIGMTYGHSITDGGGNSAASTDKMIGYYGSGTVTGFQYATVDNGVATTVLPPLAVGNTYLLEGNVAAAETAVATLASGDTISFDTTLGYTFAGNVAAEAPLVAIPSTSGTLITYSTGYFPRTATAGQDGTAEHPFEIADVDDLQALAAYTAGQSLCYVQVANIDMTSAGTFPGIGGDFTGTYDGGNYTISNIEFAADTYRGLFNKVTGATIKNLKIDTVTFAAAASGVEFGGSAFVGKVYGNTVLSNLTAKGSVGSALAPANHSIAGVATRVYGQNVKFFDCANEASVYGEVRKVAGVLGIIQGTASVDFIGCSNSGAIVTTTVTHHDIGDNKDYTTGADGLAGIIAYANAPTTLKDCVNTGAIQINSGNTGASVGELIGKCGSTTITDLGGNKGASDKKMIGTRAGTITGFQYATVESSVATTIASPYTVAAGNTYLLEGNAAPVVELADGESIAFDTALGYTLTDTGITAAQGLELTPGTDGTVKTYTAAAAAPSIPAWATDVTGDPTAIDQAVSDKYAAWAKDIAGSSADLTQDCSAQFLMNVPVAAEVALTIDGIEVTSDGTIVTIGATKTISDNTTPITLGTTDAGVDTPAINGILNVVVADSISGLSSTTAKKAIPAANLVFVNGKAQVLIPATDGRFVKASVDYSTPSSSITAVTE